jgi:trehalose 6-phosphate synthase/phosphatase
MAPLSTFSNIADNDVLPSLAELRAAIANLEREHAERGRHLSGRVLHVCHYLPVICSVTPREPSTPPRTPPDDTPRPSEWTLTHRYGHSALISGVRSLSGSHQQHLIGWTGDIDSPATGTSIPVDSLTPEQRDTLSRAIDKYHEEGEQNSLLLHPVWFSDKVAHGHYEGYCKNSTESPSPC